MIKIFNRILWGIKPPENKSDIWFDGDVFKIYRKGDWEAITIEIDAASKLADVIKNINDVYQTKLTEGDGILLEDSKISVRRMFQVVSELPKTGEYNTIYLLVENNKEIGSYIYVNNEWMSLVSTIEIDKNLNIYSTNPVENKAVTKKIESLDVVRIVEGGVNGLESGNFRDGSVGSAISSDHAFSGVTLTREHIGCTIQGVKWIYNGGLILFPNFGVNTSCTINLRNNYGDIGSIKMYYRDITSLDIDIILPNEHITLMNNSNVFLPENVNTVLTNKLAYYQIVGIYNNGFDVDSFAPYFQFDLTRDIRALYFKNGDWKKVLIEDNVKTINGHSILGEGNIVLEGVGGGGGIYEIKYDLLNGNPLSEEDIAFNAEVFDKLSRNEVSALYVVVNDEGYEIRLVADSFYYIPIDKDGHAEWVLLNFTTKSLDIAVLPQRAIRIGLDGSVVEFPFSGSGISFVRLSRPDEITTFYDNNTDDSFLSTLIVDDIDNAVNPLVGRIVDFDSGYITYSCSNGDVRRVYFNSDHTIKKRGLIEGVIYLGENLTDFQKQMNLAYVTTMKELNNYDYSSGKKKRVDVVVYYNGVFSNALAFDSSGVVILAGELELQSWTIDKEGNTTLIASTIIGGVDIDPSNFATLLEGFIPISRDFNDDFNNDFAR